MTYPLRRAAVVAAFSVLAMADVARADDDVVAVATDVECRGDALGAVIRTVERGAVNVRTHVAMGNGFAVAGGLVVTDFDLVRRPQGLRVVGPDGAEMEATVVAVDETHRIAVLRPSEPLAVTPLELAAEPATLGEDIVLVGVPDLTLRPLPPPLVRRAIVTAEGPRFAIDETTWPFTGGPLMSCSGQVVGMATTTGSVTPQNVTAVMTRAATPHVYDGPDVDLGSIEATFLTHVTHDEDPFLGVQVGVGALFVDRLELSTRVGVLAGASEPIDDVSALRVFGDLRVGYRANVSTMPIPVWLVPSAGAAFMYDYRRETSVTTSIGDPSCITEGRACELDVREQAIESERVRPMAVVGLDVRLDVLSLGYSLFVDPSEGDLVHQIGVGVASY